MAITYTPIATNTLASTSTSVTLSSIAGTYTDLVLIIAGTSNTLAAIDTQFNGDTATNYSRTVMSGNGTTASSSRSSSVAAIPTGLIDTTQSVTIINIMNYSNTTTYKTIIARGNTASSQVNTNIGLWRSTAAISSVTLSGLTFQIGTSFTLYGIKAA
jgi:hypothetical protein